jgi:hypothetical protein
MARRTSDKPNGRPTRKQTKGTGKSHRTAPKRAQQRTKQTALRTAAQYHARTEKFKEIWDRVVSVISKMRGEKTSLQKAAKEKNISPRTVKRWAGSALQKSASRKWSATPGDRLLREMRMITTDGERDILVRGSRQATQLSRYSRAVQTYVRTGDASELLAKFHGRFIKDANGLKLPFLTDLDELKRRASAGALSFESLYTRS